MIHFKRLLIRKMSTLIGIVLIGLLIGVYNFVSSIPASGSSTVLSEPRWIGINEYRGGVNLSWFRVQGAVGYRVLRRIGEDADFQELKLVSNPSFDDFMVELGKGYFYRIVPVDHNGLAGPPSPTRFIFLEAPEPGMVLSPDWAVHQNRDEGVALSWFHDNIDHIIAFNLYRKKEGDESFTLLTSAVDTTYLDRDVLAGNKYHYVVTALDRKLRESDYSAILTLTYSLIGKKSLGNSKLRAIKTLEEVVQKTELISELNWQSYGFVSPADIEFDPGTKRLYISDTGTGLISVVDLAGELLAQFGGLGESAWNFERLLGIALSPDGYVYATDAYRGEIVVFSPRGIFNKRIMLKDQVQQYFGQTLYEKYPWFRFGIVDIEFLPDGSLVVVDNPNGWFYVLNDANELVRVVSEKGYLNTQMHYPTFVAIDNIGQVIISDTLNSRLQVLTQFGDHKKIIGERGLGIGQFLRPKGIAVSESGAIFVADSQLNVIQEFSKTGEFVSLLGDERGLPIDLGSPNGLAFIEPNLLLISERIARRVQVRRLLSSDLNADERPAVGKQPQRIREKAILTRPVEAIRWGPVMRQLSNLAENGGSMVIDERIFTLNTSLLIPSAIPVLQEINEIAKSNKWRLTLRVLALDGKNVSSNLAKERIGVINSYISEGSQIKYFVTKVAPVDNPVDRLELMVEKVQ